MAAPAIDDFRSVVPAWRRMKLRRTLSAAEHEGSLGQPCEHEHRALRRRWLLGANANRQPRLEDSRPDLAWLLAIWKAIYAWRGTVPPPGDHWVHGAQKRAWEAATAACIAAGIKPPSYATVHAWFNYESVPTEFLNEIIGQPVMEPVAAIIGKTQKRATELMVLLAPVEKAVMCDLAERLGPVDRSFLPSAVQAAWMRCGLDGRELPPPTNSRTRRACQWPGWVEGGHLTYAGRIALIAYDIQAAGKMAR